MEGLQKYRAEARKVSIYEYDAKRHIRMETEEAEIQKIMIAMEKEKVPV